MSDDTFVSHCNKLGKITDEFTIKLVIKFLNLEFSCAD